MTEQLVTADELAAYDAAHNDVGLFAEWLSSPRRAAMRVVPASEVPPWEPPPQLRAPTAFVTHDGGDDVIFARPDAAHTDVDPDPATVPHLSVERNEYRFVVSRTMALDFGLVEPTLTEKLDREVERTRIDVDTARRRAAPGPAVTLEAVLDHLGLPREFVEHWLHDACWCHPLDDDPMLCSWATELGWELRWDDDAGRQVRRVTSP